MDTTLLTIELKILMKISNDQIISERPIKTTPNKIFSGYFLYLLHTFIHTYIHTYNINGTKIQMA